MQAQLKRRLREVAGGLRLPRPSTEQAVHLLERAVPLVMQPNCHWRREHLVGAAAYAACRQEKLGGDRDRDRGRGRRPEPSWAPLQTPISTNVLPAGLCRGLPRLAVWSATL